MEAKKGDDDSLMTYFLPLMRRERISPKYQCLVQLTNLLKGGQN
jgi:hypothetical protein